MSTYSPRLEAPSSSDLNYIKTTHGGYNYCINIDNGSVLPNCVGYAWGRWREILGKYHKLSRGNAENWYPNTSDGYERGQDPKLGAVACWEDPNGAGHVAIVEVINDDGTIITSNSAYGGQRFYLLTFDENMRISGYNFQGFIYLPIEFDNSIVTPESKNGYLNIYQMQNNARYIYRYLSRKGWSLNAIAGMLGNMQVESTINPGIWQSLDEGNTSVGLGLVQWTPAEKLIAWCDSNGYDYLDMDAQLDRIIYEMKNNIQWIETDTYPMTFEEFSTSTEDVGILASIFLHNYERAGVEVEQTRITYALNWYSFLKRYVNTGFSIVTKRKKFKWLLFRKRKGIL